MFLESAPAGRVSTQGWVLGSQPSLILNYSHICWEQFLKNFTPAYLQPTLAGFLLKTTWNRKCLHSLYPWLRTELAKLLVEIKKIKKKKSDTVPGIEVG